MTDHRDPTAELLAFAEDVLGFLRALRTPSWCACGRRKLHDQAQCSKCDRLAREGSR
jgi:hypothetical protein